MNLLKEKPPAFLIHLQF